MTKSRNIRVRRNSPLDVRLARFSIVDRATGCTLWIGSRNREGYGEFGFRGRKMMAHRAAWIVKRGAIPSGIQVCHKCDVRNCINVDHLFLGTPLENVADMRRKGRGPDHQRIGTFHQGEKCTFAKLTAASVVEIRASTKSRAALSAQYGVSPNQIYRIRNRIDWRHVK